MRKSARKAFTLVEILIVVVSLGILAAIVVPQFTSATQDAQTGNIRAQLKSLQNQIELFKARSTDGQYPDLVGAGWDTMIDPNGDGDLTDGYIKAAAKNPFNNSTTVGAAAAVGTGWHYNRTTGVLGACYYDESTDTLTPATP
ncbi:MAG: type II secretion system protein [Phycisphaerales bacterium]